MNFNDELDLANNFSCVSGVSRNGKKIAMCRAFYIFNRCKIMSLLNWWAINNRILACRLYTVKRIHWPKKMQRYLDLVNDVQKRQIAAHATMRLHLCRWDWQEDWVETISVINWDWLIAKKKRSEVNKYLLLFRTEGLLISSSLEQTVAFGQQIFTL